jgi:hypothetical protein
VRRSTWKWPTAALAAVLLAGCGGGGGGGDSGGGISKSEYISRADAICAAGNGEGQTIQKRVFPASGKVSGVQLQEFFTQALPVYRDTDGKLAALPAPSGDEQVIAALIAAARKGEAGAEAAAQTPAKAKAAIKNDPFAEFTARARAYGLKSCSGG